MHLAAERNHADVVRAFIDVDPYLIVVASKDGKTCAHIAAQNGSSAVVRELLHTNHALVTKVRNRISESLPLHLAVSTGHKDIVRMLINAGSSTKSENAEGMTAIHLAAREGNMEVLQSIPSKVSLKTTSEKNGLAPVHVAAFYGNVEVTRELLSRDSINAKTRPPYKANVVKDENLKLLITSDVSFQNHPHRKNMKVITFYFSMVSLRYTWLHSPDVKVLFE